MTMYLAPPFCHCLGIKRQVKIDITMSNNKVHLNCAADGNPKPRVDWFRNFKPLVMVVCDCGISSSSSNSISSSYSIIYLITKSNFNKSFGNKI